MKEEAIPDYLKLTPEEEQQAKLLGSMLKLAASLNAGEAAHPPATLPAYMEGAVIMTHLQVWAGGGKVWKAKVALIDGADVNAPDERGMSALHYAVEYGEPAVVKLLLQAGADIGAKSPSGETPIDIARAQRKESLIQLMLPNGQDLQVAQNVDDRQWQQLTTRAKRAYEIENYTEAEKAWRAALQEAEKFGPLDTRLASALRSLGSFYQDRGQYAEAQPLYSQSCRIKEKAGAQDDPDYVECIMNMAECSFRLGNYEQSTEYVWGVLSQANFFGLQEPPAENAPLYERALQLIKSAAEFEPTGLASFFNLGDLYSRFGRLDEAEQLYIRSVSHAKKEPGQSNDALLSLERLAALYESQQRHEEAKAMREEAENMKKISGDPRQQRWG